MFGCETHHVLRLLHRLQTFANQAATHGWEGCGHTPNGEDLGSRECKHTQARLIFGTSGAPRFHIQNYPGKRPQTVCVSVHLREAKVNPHDICNRISVWGSWPLVSGSYRTTCTRSRIRMLSNRLCQDPLGPLVQDLCIKILWDHLCKISVSGSLCEWSFGPLVSGSYRTTCTRSPIRMLSDRLCQDPLGPLVQDLCIKILWDNLCKISVSGSLCEDPLGHLYHDPALALVQDLCIISV